MKPADIRKMSDHELEQRTRDLKDELFNLRFQNATGQLENALRLREVRRDIARCMTILRERELAEQARQANEA